VDAVVDPESVALLPDPTPPGATMPGQWWPPQWLDPGFVRDRVPDIDVMHVHFGFDSADPVDLEDVAGELARRGVPLVVTVHDLHNPHFEDAGLHATRLGVLLGVADAVITLTDGAAAEIERRWGRRSVVLPHPHVLPIDEVGSARVRRPVPVVAVHAKGLRANIDPWPLLDALLDGGLDGYRLRLDLDIGALASPRAAEVGEHRLAAYRAAGVDVRVHPCFDDRELSAYLADVDVLVLPYRFGTHSGWVEAAHDAGVHTVVPDCGYFQEQHASALFHYDRTEFDATSLTDAVEAAVSLARSGAASVDEARRRRRADERHRVRAAHVRLYRQVLANRNAA
jgi:glycosyltransferase involved in cell wall biosynthesis